MATEEERKRRAAARSKRHRDRKKLHDRGDHSTCLPGAACKRPAAPPPGPPVEASEGPVDLDGEGLNEGDGDAGEGVTRDVTAPSKNQASHRPRPAGLGERGGRLWDDMEGLRLTPHHVFQLERLCRMADRLVVLDELAKGRAWVEVVPVPNTDGAVLQLVVDKVLSEIRQIETVVTRATAELRYAGRAEAPSAGSPGAPPGRGVDDDDDESAAGSPGGNVTSIADVLRFGKGS